MSKRKPLPSMMGDELLKSLGRKEDFPGKLFCVSAYSEPFAKLGKHYTMVGVDVDDTKRYSDGHSLYSFLRVGDLKTFRWRFFTQTRYGLIIKEIKI